MKKILSVSLLLFYFISAISQEKPNIIIIMTDDQSPKTISAYGGLDNNTPNIDRIADEGVIFENSFCANSICQPSRAAIMTGKHGNKNRVTGNVTGDFDATQTTMPRILKENGYSTAVFGKWHLPTYPDSERGRNVAPISNPSFDDWKVLTGAGNQGYYYNPTFKEKGNIDSQIEGYDSDIITDLSLDWIEEHKSSPFYVMVHFKSAHYPHLPAERFLGKYDGQTIPKPATLLDDYESYNNELADSPKMPTRLTMPNVTYNYFPSRSEIDYSDRKYDTSLGRMTEEQRIPYHNYYDPINTQFNLDQSNSDLVDGTDEMKEYLYQRKIKDLLMVIDAVDENVGRILDYLDENNLDENTIIIYTSDQGYFIGEYYGYEKRYMYEESMSMPLLMRFPKLISPNTKVDKLVQNIDYAPSLLDMAEIEVPQDMQGASFKNIVGNTPSVWREAVYYHYYDHNKHTVPRHEGVRTKKYKLINFYTDNEWEFYDLENDKLERNNLYADPTYKSVIEILKIELAELRKEYDLIGSEAILENFEGGLFYSENAKHDWTTTNTTGDSFSVVNNPQSDDVNSSDKVGEISMTSTIATVEINFPNERQITTNSGLLTDPIAYEAFNLTLDDLLKIKILSETDAILKVVFSSTESLERYQTEININGNGNWNEYSIDLSAINSDYKQNTLNKFELELVANTVPVGGAIYFDDIKFEKDNNLGTGGIESDILIIYPNPTNNKVFINSPSKVINIELLNINGKRIAWLEGNDITEYSLANISSGIYFMKCNTQNNSSITRLIKH